MSEFPEPAICQFYRLIPGAPEPRRADRSADGTLPTRAYRYCESVASASGFGWYIYPPLNFSLIWDGVEIAWTYEGAEGWYPLRGAQFPGFRQIFEEVAPDAVTDVRGRVVEAAEAGRALCRRQPVGEERAEQADRTQGVGGTKLRPPADGCAGGHRSTISGEGGGQPPEYDSAP